MKDINIHIPGGSMVAIVGPTGAGKSTLVNLIMRFYDIMKGRITIDGIDIRDVSRESLHNTVGMVLQDAWIFTGTIADNIGYGKPKCYSSGNRICSKACHGRSLYPYLAKWL